MRPTRLSGIVPDLARARGLLLAVPLVDGRVDADKQQGIRQSRQPADDGNAPRVAAVELNGAYRLDSGDRVRVVVSGQDALSNSYDVEAAARSRSRRWAW